MKKVLKIDKFFQNFEKILSHDPIKNKILIFLIYSHILYKNTYNKIKLIKNNTKCIKKHWLYIKNSVNLYKMIEKGGIYDK